MPFSSAITTLLCIVWINTYLFLGVETQDHCHLFPVLSTCRLPVHYKWTIDRTFYTKFVDAKGIPVLASDKVSNRALVAAARMATKMLERRPDYAYQIVLRANRLVVLGRDERLPNLPEFRNQPRARADLRGYNSLGVTVCPEENLLCEQWDEYKNYGVCVHEFSHSIDAAFTKADPVFKRFVVQAYRQAVDQGDRWSNTYAGKDPAEYFAELSAMWFDAGQRDVVPGVFNGIWSKEMLKNYDPFMAAMLERVYGDDSWRYSCDEVCHNNVIENMDCS